MKRKIPSERIAKFKSQQIQPPETRLLFSILPNRAALRFGGTSQFEDAGRLLATSIALRPGPRTEERALKNPKVRGTPN